MSDSHKTSSVEDCRFIELPRHRHENGSLTVAENIAKSIPFAIRRVYYIYDVPTDANRGGHSHFEDQKIMIALSGSFDVIVDDGIRTRRITLNRPYMALYIPTGLWRTLENFSGGAICLSLASERYSEADYVRDYTRFKALTANKLK